MKCSICNVHVLTKPLFRNNEKGIKAEWRCKEHLSPCSEPNKETEELVNVIHKGNDK